MKLRVTSHWWDRGKVLQKQPLVERLRAFHAINRSFRFRERIEEWLSGGVVRPSHFRNHLQKLLAQDGEMADLSVSRPSSRQHWGIPVPGDSTQVQTSFPQYGFPLTNTRLREVRTNTFVRSTETEFQNNNKSMPNCQMSRFPLK